MIYHENTAFLRQPQGNGHIGRGVSPPDLRYRNAGARNGAYTEPVSERSPSAHDAFLSKRKRSTRNAGARLLSLRSIALQEELHVGRTLRDVNKTPPKIQDKNIFGEPRPPYAKERGKHSNPAAGRAAWAHASRKKPGRNALPQARMGLTPNLTDVNIIQWKYKLNRLSKRHAYGFSHGSILIEGKNGALRFLCCASGAKAAVLPRKPTRANPATRAAKTRAGKAAARGNGKLRRKGAGENKARTNAAPGGPVKARPAKADARANSAQNANGSGTVLKGGAQKRHAAYARRAP